MSLLFQKTIKYFERSKSGVSESNDVFLICETCVNRCDQNEERVDNSEDFLPCLISDLTSVL